MHYRRAKIPGATYFFTVVTYNRQHLFKHPETVQLLRQSFHTVKQQHPFIIEAIVVLPDHLHCIWTLPAGDADFSTRWRLIKSHFTRHCPEPYKRARSVARRHKQEQAVWQRRFWEHQIRDEQDFSRHIDYIHYNPVNHGCVRTPREWPYSSFHRFVGQGLYSQDWGKSEEVGLIKAWE